MFLSPAGQQSQVAGDAADRTVQLIGHPQGSMDAVREIKQSYQKFKSIEQVSIIPLEESGVHDEI